MTELVPYFEPRHRFFFPLMVPSYSLNLVFGMTLERRR